ncbi:MAG: hybrid sensor histidine kinase/response regulator [Catalinimonas sp.]
MTPTDGPPLRILLLEDAETDAEMIKRLLLRLQDRPAEVHVVDNRRDFVRAFETQLPDLVLADYTVPGFNGREALRWVRAHWPLLPFVFVTGTLSEERAVETLREGANDFLLKDNLERLGFSIRRALHDAEKSRDRDRAERALRAGEAQFVKVFQANPLPTAVVEFSTGRFVEANERLLTLVNHTREALLGKSVQALDLHVDPDAHQALMQAVRGERTMSGHEVRLRIDGRTHDLLLSTERVRLNGRDCLLIMMLDDTERRQTFEQLQRHAELLTLSNRELELFAHITSHDLRAPVVNLRSLLTIYEDNKLGSPRNREVMQRLDETVRRMEDTLEDLAEIVAAGRPEEASRRPLRFEETYESVRRSLEEKQMLAGADLAGDFSAAPVVYFSQKYLRSVLFHLLTNAVKYAHPGRPLRVRVRSYPEGERVVLAVSDNGRGIDMRQNGEKLFELHRRFHTDVPGRGLGLYLLKTQLEALGGHVRVDSRPGRGTEFFCYFLSPTPAA